MEKPVIYLQFDRETFFHRHYGKGYFDYDKMGFGEVVCNEEEAVETLKTYINTDFSLKPEYRQQIQKFFPLHDNKNCERIYNEIENLKFR